MPTDPEAHEAPTATPLETFLKFADAIQTAHADARRPAYAETCPCGGSVEVSRDVTAAERRRIHVDFLGRHQHCTREARP